jgi:hypothetical protein
MSLVITLWVREGIVLASDSRLTLSSTVPAGDKQLVNVAVAQSDSSYKTFLLPPGIGISTYGAAEIAGVPIAGFVESFIEQQQALGTRPVQAVAVSLLEFFRAMTPCPKVQFHVAGYEKTNDRSEQFVFGVDVAANTNKRVNPPNDQGAAWGGEFDILSRLLMPLAELDGRGQVSRVLPHYPVPWQFLTLQDAVDFAVFAIRSTSDAIRFQPRPKTVGGPIDVLVIKPTGASFVKRKQLSVSGGV